MGTVNGYTAEKMDSVLGQTVASAEVVGDDLILTKIDGSTQNAGNVRGPGGPALTELAGYREPQENKGNVAGNVTLDFATYNNWIINPTGPITIIFANLPAAGYVAPGTLIVLNSTYAITWPAGTKFPNALPPSLSGETWISILARSTHVTVGAAWVGVG